MVNHRFANVNDGSLRRKQKNNATQSIVDKTPIAEEELSDLPPDMILNDAISISGVLQGNTEYDTFYKGLKSADMIRQLDSSTVYTIFAPTNTAFNRITEAKLAKLKTPEGRDEMKHVLSYHVVADEYDFETLESTIRLNENILRLKKLNGA